MRIPQILAATLLITTFALDSTAADTTRRSSAQPASQSVRVDDLNLQSPGGVQRLARRIDAAVERVCAAEDGRSLAQWGKARQCRREAHERAVRQASLLHTATQVARD